MSLSILYPETLRETTKMHGYLLSSRYVRTNSSCGRGFPFKQIFSRSLKKKIVFNIVVVRNDVRARRRNLSFRKPRRLIIKPVLSADRGSAGIDYTSPVLRLLWIGAGTGQSWNFNGYCRSFIGHAEWCIAYAAHFWHLCENRNI